MCRAPGMATTQTHDAVRDARDACARARKAHATARANQTRAMELRATARALREQVRTDLSDRVVRTTQLVDSGEWAWPLFSTYVTEQAARLGRDPAIEEAKTLLVERYGVSRREAFLILSHMSSVRNEKVASVARHLLDDGADLVA